MYKIAIYTLGALFIGGCSSVPTIRNLDSSVRSSIGPGNGIAFGKIVSEGAWGTAVIFKNLATNEERQISGAKDFAVELPAGNYSLSSFGGRARQVKPQGSSQGLTFSIKPGKAAYVGHLVLGSLGESQSCGRDLVPSLAPKFKRAFPHVGYNKGFLSMGKIEEVDWDKKCLLQYDSLATDYRISKIDSFGISLSEVISP